MRQINFVCSFSFFRKKKKSIQNIWLLTQNAFKNSAFSSSHLQCVFGRDSFTA